MLRPVKATNQNKLVFVEDHYPLSICFYKKHKANSTTPSWELQRPNIGILYNIQLVKEPRNGFIHVTMVTGYNAKPSRWATSTNMQLIKNN